MKFNVPNRFTGAVQFTADIDCTEGSGRSIKMGLAVRWAVKNNANLENANLENANLENASLWGASLWGASLWGANLRSANLRSANLEDANLEDANLEDANLRGANLWVANLRGANLEDANLRGASGVNDWIKCIQIDTYPITYTDTVMQIGCERHLISEWAEFDNARIAQMGSKTSLRFWAKYKDWIFQTIDLCPARPTNSKTGDE